MPSNQKTRISKGCNQVSNEKSDDSIPMDTVEKAMKRLYNQIIQDNASLQTSALVNQFRIAATHPKRKKKNLANRCATTNSIPVSHGHPQKVIPPNKEVVQTLQLLDNSVVIQQVHDSQSIPPTIQDLYSMTIASPSLALSQSAVEQQFRSLNYTETFWDSTTFELLAFGDNFVHYVARPKQELMDGTFTLMQACLPVSRSIVHQTLVVMAKNGRKLIELDAMFFREIDRKIVFLHHKLHFEGRYIRIQHYADAKSNDEFVIDGKLFTKSYELNSSNITNADAQYSKLASKASRLMQTLAKNG